MNLLTAIVRPVDCNQTLYVTSNSLNTQRHVRKSIYASGKKELAKCVFMGCVFTFRCTYLITCVHLYIRIILMDILVFSIPTRKISIRQIHFIAATCIILTHVFELNEHMIMYLINMIVVCVVGCTVKHSLVVIIQNYYNS